MKTKFKASKPSFMENKDYKCVSLKGELSDWGNHVLMPYGITLCGMPTVDASTDQFPQLKKEAMVDMINEYTTIDKWDITCEKCLELIDMFKEAKQRKEN